MKVEDLEIRYRPRKFTVFINYELAGQKNRDKVISVEFYPPTRILPEDVLVFVLKELSWLFQEER